MLSSTNKVFLFSGVFFTGTTVKFCFCFQEWTTSLRATSEQKPLSVADAASVSFMRTNSPEQ